MKRLVVVNKDSHPKSRLSNRGFTLIELLIVVVIVAIGVALAVPSYQNIVQKRRVTSAAEQIAAFFALAQSEAIKRNEVVAVTVTRESDTEWCVGAMIQNTAADHCDCESIIASADEYCDFDVDFDPEKVSAPQLINQAGFRSFTMNGVTPSNDFNFYFDPIRGTKVLGDGSTVDSGSHNVTLTSSNDNHSLRVGISVTGRVQVCSPVSTKAVPGFKPCT